MSKTIETKASPAYRIYGVMKNGEKKATWAELGAAWPNKDGKGFNLSFIARPLEGAEIVLREPLPTTEEPKSSRRTAGRYDQLKDQA